MAAIPAPPAGGGRGAQKIGPPPLPKKKDVARDVLAGLAGGIEPVPVSFLYQAGLVLVALAMLVLPLVYVAFVTLMAYGVYWHATRDITIFEGRGNARARVLAYVLPIIAGGLLVLFLVKPLFARRVRSSHPLSLTRDEEPLLFAFVDRLCEVVGAPKPRRIDVDTEVNASASFMRGIWGVLTNRLVLTIGLPLVAGLDLRQFTGVLAHEFGHFAQGSAMRLTFVVRSINMWFARVVYERDEWDYKLAQFGREMNHWAASLVILVAQLGIWISRRVLWALMWAGHFISSFMLRQMEFDADRYEARVAGSDVFEQTSLRINLLGVASRAAFSDLGSAWRERRLCDDLPSLIRSRESQLPGELRKAVNKACNESKTGWLDSHPCDSARVASARRESAPGIFAVDAPASVLFRNFPELSRRATVAFYFDAVGPEVRPENLIPTEQLVATRGKQREDVKSLRRYFCDLVNPIRPTFPSRFGFTDVKALRTDAAAEKLLELRTKLCADAKALAPAVKEFDQNDDKLIALERVRELTTAGAKLPKLDPKELGLTRLGEAEVNAALKAAAAERDASRAKLDQALAGGVQRLTIALCLERQFAPPTAAPAPREEGDAYDLVDETPAGSDDRLLDALRVLREASADVESLRRHFILLGTVLSQVQPGQNAQSLIDTVLWHSRKASDLLRNIHSITRGATYPYPHLHKQVSVAQYMAPGLPPAEEPVAVHNAADTALDGFYSLYVRLMSDLAARAEKVEESLGLPPMPDPPEDPEELAADAAAGANV